MASTDIKGFYRHKKKGGIAKPSKKISSKYTGGASVRPPDPAQTPALIAHGSVDLDDEYGEEEEEERLRQFDMDMRYGPCIGLTRLQRWERAAAMGLNPPADVASLLQGSKNPSLDCLWEGQV